MTNEKSFLNICNIFQEIINATQKETEVITDDEFNTKILYSLYVDKNDKIKKLDNLTNDVFNNLQLNEEQKVQIQNLRKQLNTVFEENNKAITIALNYSQKILEMFSVLPQQQHDLYNYKDDCLTKTIMQQQNSMIADEKR